MYGDQKLLLNKAILQSKNEKKETVQISSSGTLNISEQQKCTLL